MAKMAINGQPARLMGTHAVFLITEFTDTHLLKGTRHLTDFHGKVDAPWRCTSAAVFIPVRYGVFPETMDMGHEAVKKNS
tara:strand:+ start:41 stop:280 length:240 start_codon:yes stop_codon:yes gene_type:complete